MKDRKAIVWQIWQIGSINISTDQNLVVLIFTLWAIKLCDFKMDPNKLKW